MATDHECSIELCEFLEGSAQPRVTQVARGLGCLNNGSKIRGFDLARTSCSSPIVNSVPIASAFTAFPRNFDCKFKQGIEHFGIVLRNLAKDALKHFLLLASKLNSGVMWRS